MQIIQGSGNVSAYGRILQNRALDGENIMNLLSEFNYLSFQLTLYALRCFCR